MNKSLSLLPNFLKFIPSFTASRSYAGRTRNILRNRYPYKNKDGTFMEYNETITVIPKEFEQQDEYKQEKLQAKIYEERYKNHLKMKEKLYSLKVSKETIEKELSEITGPKELTGTEGQCEHSAKDGVAQNEENSKPIRLKKDPYKKPIHQCIFCKYNVPLDYKNVQLLSQFISPHTGLVYSQQVTGLCYHKYEQLEKTVLKARKLGLKPFFYKETVFVNDPILFDPFKNNLKLIPNNYDRRKLNADESSDDQVDQNKP